MEKMWADERLPLGYRYFMSTYEQTIVAIVEKGAHKDQLAKIGDPLIKQELSSLWEKIEGTCKEIIDISVSLLHQDPSSMVEIL